MKLLNILLIINILFLFIHIRCITLSKDLIKELATNFKTQEQCLKNSNLHKVLLYSPLHDIKYNDENPLNHLTYKNIFLSNNELLAFTSVNYNIPDKDVMIDT